MTNKSDPPLFATPAEACQWLANVGIELRPKQLIEAAAQGQVSLHVGTIAGSAAFEPTGPVLNVRQRAADELLPVTPDDCNQFLLLGEVDIHDARERGAQEWVGSMPPPMRVFHESAFRIKGNDLRAFAVRLLQDRPTMQRKGKKRDALATLFDQIEKGLAVQTDYADAWNKLVALAQGETPPPPLLGFDREINYGDAADPQTLTRDNFRKRWQRRHSK